MTVRRQSSATSLAKFARVNSPDLSNRSLDFCNSFWGSGDAGVDVLFARMRGATRTMEELKNYWKERASIEEDYAKRLSKLAKSTLGRDEIGELRNSLDTIRLETDKQAGFHLQLAKQVREDLEVQAGAFHNKQIHHKKVYQSAIEKEFKDRQLQESYVNKARQKYESDCNRINSFTAQSALAQGKELEKLHLKLDRAQQTVQANQRDYANFVRTYGDTTQKWEQDWKSFCDGCQDLEEDRMDFMKENLWAYANAVSTVCVSDDESCEKIRLALEQMEPEREMENFVRDYGTGNAIPDPPTFVNYASPDAVPSSSSRPTTKPAHFPRSTLRQNDRAVPPPEPEEPFVNTAGVGAGGGAVKDSLPEGTLHRTGTSRGRQINGTGPPAGQGSSAQHNVQRLPTFTNPPSFKPPHDLQAEPIDPNADTYIKVGPNAYKVDLSKDPQQGASGSNSGSVSGHPRTTAVASQNGSDPLAKQMEALKHAATTGSTRKNSTHHKAPPSRHGTADASGTGSLALAPPMAASSSSSSNTPAQKDYRNSAEIVVGSYPVSSRPSSPAPSASFMKPPPRSVSPAAQDLPVETIVADYERPLPGQRHRSISRPNSRNGPSSNQGPGPSSSSHSHSHNQSIERPVSRTGHPGIGAHGGSRSTSPIAGFKAPSSSSQASSGATFNKTGSVRSHSPNPSGIALGPDGRVIKDTMADRYRQQQQQQQSQPPTATHYGVPNQGPGVVQRQQSYLSGPPTQPPYGAVPPPPPNVYQTPPQQFVPTPQQPYNTTQPQAYPIQQPIYQQPNQGRMAGYGVNGAGVNLNPSYPAGYPAGAVRQQQVIQGPPSQNEYYRGTSPAPPSPQPQLQPPSHSQQHPPTGQTTEDGRGILFYVKALYDYSATIEEEFDFQAGDIIAVTATPEDGWWSGELLDEARRQPGKHVFPSNFVCLF